MTQENHSFEDEAIQAAIADFGLESPMEGVSDPEGPRVREYRELLGLLALAAPPVTASTDLKERLMTELLGEETQEVEHLVKKVQEYSQEKDLETKVFPIMNPEPSSPSSGRWLKWAAAAMLFGIVALGSVSTFLYRQVETMNQRLASLALEMEEAASSRELNLATTRSLLADTKQNLTLVTSSSTEICPLRAPGGSVVPTARGILYVAPDHQHWYLRVQGLKQSEGQQYRLWFLVGEGLSPVDGGSLDLQAGREATIGSATMPEDTKAVKITLEDRNSYGDPDSPTVVYGDDMLRIL